MIHLNSAAVYTNKACREQSIELLKTPSAEIDITKTPAQGGVTYELCAGIIDKNISVAEIAKMEILEEVGYDVSVESLEEIITAR